MTKKYRSREPMIFTYVVLMFIMYQLKNYTLTFGLVNQKLITVHQGSFS